MGLSRTLEDEGAGAEGWESALNRRDSLCKALMQERALTVLGTETRLVGGG